MFNNKLNFNNSKSFVESIEILAKKIAMKGLLEINESKYRIIDFELYINSSTDIAKDPHTYNNDLQKSSAKLYDHASGLDITFGDKENAVGVLIRGIAKLSNKDHNATEKYFIDEYYDGPHKARTELIGNLRFNDNNKLSFNEATIEMGTYLKPHNVKLIKTKRVNLTPKTADPTDKYINETLRYIVLIPRFYKENNKFIANGNPIKIKGLEKELKIALRENTIDLQTAENILGYNVKL